MSPLTILWRLTHPDEITGSFRSFEAFRWGRKPASTSPFCHVLWDHLPGLSFPFPSGCSSFAQNVLKVLPSQSNLQQLITDHCLRFLGPVEIVAFQQRHFSSHRKDCCLGFRHQCISTSSESVLPIVSPRKLDVLGNDLPKLTRRLVLEVGKVLEREMKS